jgi:hypothetical protein
LGNRLVSRGSAATARRIRRSLRRLQDLDWSRNPPATHSQDRHRHPRNSVHMKLLLSCAGVTPFAFKLRRTKVTALTQAKHQEIRALCCNARDQMSITHVETSVYLKETPLVFARINAPKPNSSRTKHLRRQLFRRPLLPQSRSGTPAASQTRTLPSSGEIRTARVRR